MQTFSFVHRMAVRKGSRARAKRRKGLASRLLIGAMVLLVGFPGAGILLYGILPPPVTPLMMLRLFEGERLDRDWRPRNAIAPDLFRAVIAAEDARFCDHFGFDPVELKKAFRDWQRGGRVRGASTITMQTAKNLFLWPGRDFLRKAVEAYLTPWLEIAWSKTRVLELYVNVAEWGPGIYGVEAAARAYFGKPASALSKNEAALLAAVLPNPRVWSPVKPSAYIRQRARTIRARMPDAPVSTDEICAEARTS
ncbi:MAG TPA: monofunctional biosynthetic peptidoglycan transglycosylase [Alphaproteobacteria bacterium]|nr:monofunctional biosynthetic peptidoglycan transglycosylase [Alphaproteobacteria bacterium]